MSAAGLARLTPDGRYVEQPPGAREKVILGLTKVGGEWRVELPETGFGLWLDNDQFNRVFVNRFVYYVTPTGRDLVPDSRWFPIGTRLATTLARAQLSAVPGHLAGAVTTGVPHGHASGGQRRPGRRTAGPRSTSAARRSRPTPAGRAAMWAQLTKTLGQVASVELGVAGGRQHPARAARRRDLGGSPRRSSATTSSPDLPRHGPAAHGDAIRRFDPRYVPDTQDAKRPDLKPKDGDIARIPDTWRSLALSVDGKQVAAVSANRRDLSIWRATEQTEVGRPVRHVADPTRLRRRRLPLDRRQRRARRRPRLRPRLRLERPDSAPKPISTPWLGDRRVKAIAVAADATRVLIVTTDRSGGDAQLGLSGIVRATNGEPEALSQPLRQAQSLTAHPGRHVARPGRATPSSAR